MKLIHVVSVAALTLIALAFAYSQSPRVRQSVEVTSQTIASQPGGKPYVIDLTRKGKTYKVAADVAGDVRIRTPKGETAMTDLMKKLGLTGDRFLAGSSFLIGTPSDLSAVNFGRRPATRTANTATAKNIKCGPVICECDPDIAGDCLGRKALCATPMVCYFCGNDCPLLERGRYICVCFII